ncbi:histidyl-trna synthetase [Moniliophthora roreri MCA 2997]|uniref:histidine--tRNA ligase n=2 Tax=Moniliophthora roreri TaxID=221103 RepID=V2X3F1_MONRO|nr:histidyl-trna synthetase [Moniliophthora roreri MCA 2997]KAI3609593.1 histidyl-trna synthetase [Moniliophthora roreri]
MLCRVSRIHRLPCTYTTRTSTRRFSSMASLESIEEEIAKQNAKFNELRLQPNGDPSALEEVRKKLGELKKTLGQAKAAAGGGKKKEERERLLLKTAKGTRDFGPAEMHCREHVERIVKECFTLFGGSCLDTPVFERKDILTGKYGEDQKLIFDLMDQGGEQLALRYDHTVPLARYLAMMGGNVTQHKLWQIGKVYRRDQPVMSKGRMREFSQADFDISGPWDTMIPDAEILSLLSTILTRLDVGEFTIKLNHRKILDGIFEVCGVPAEKIRTISSAVDKLDKSPWSEVKREMTEEKGLDPAVADRIGEYVKHKGGPSLLEQLLTDSKLTANASAKQGLEEIGLLFRLLSAYDIIDKVSFDLSLARGLDYYTGIIYEAIVEASAPPGFKANPDPSTSTAPSDNPPPPKKKFKKPKQGGEEEEDEVDESQVGVGSIAAGGRYDNLVGMFTAAAASADSAKKAAKAGTPCVGVSIGLDRIFALVYPKWIERGMRQKDTMVYVMAAGDGLLEERIKLVRELREAGVKSDYLAKTKPKLPAQFDAGEKDEVPFAVILGESELREGLVTVKEQRWEMKDGKKVKIVTEGDNKGEKVSREGLVDWLKSRELWKEWQP